MKKINIAERFYEYSEQNILGSGSFASVYKGINCQNEQVVAIKVIKLSKLQKYGEKIYNQIGSEVNILQQIVKESNNDPCANIVSIYDTFSTANHIYIILEFCNGGCLLDIIKANKQGMPEKTAVDILYQITNAVAYLARHNIVHRDIKPENVFIHNGVFKLGDFGFASQNNCLQTKLGTYPYMAPEFFERGSYDKAIDVWAIGVIYHEMLFNELFFGFNRVEVEFNIKNNPYKIVNDSKISINSKDVLTKCIEKDCTKRITADNLLAHPLFDAVKAELALLKPNNQTPQLLKENQAIVNINKRLINTRNGLIFLTQLAETLEQNFLNECKFDIFFLIRKCLNGLNGLLMSLQSSQPPSFLESRQEDWALFLQSPLYNTNLTIIEQDYILITQKLKVFSQFLDIFIRKHLPQHYQSIIQVINSNEQQIVSLNAFQAKIKMIFDYFFELFSKEGDNKFLMLSLRLAIAINIDKIIVDNVFDFEQLQNDAPNYQTNDIINAINIAISI